MGLSDWLKTQATALAISFASVEKNALGQVGKELSDVDGMHQRLNQGRLSDDLLRGELSQQVKEIRWRTYKVLQEVEDYTTKLVPIYEEGNEPEPVYGENGTISHYTEGVIEGYETITEKRGDLKQKELDGLKLDPFDEYEPELCVMNDIVAEGVVDTMNNSAISTNKPIINEDGDQATHGEITSEHLNTSRYQRPLLIERKYRPRIEIERFTKRMVVRNISEDEKLLELYISMYADDYDKRTSLVVAECKKISKEGLLSDMVELDKIGFITMDDIGVPDYQEYQYDITSFDKVVEHDGNYIFKFNAKPIVNGKNLLDEFIEEDLNERYKNKEKK